MREQNVTENTAIHVAESEMKLEKMQEMGRRVRDENEEAAIRKLALDRGTTMKNARRLL